MQKLLFTFCVLLSHSLYTSGQSCNIDGVFHSNFEDISLSLDNNNCNSCHAQGAKEGGWSYETYDDFISSGNCNNTMIIHGNAGESFFYNLISDGSEICGNENKNHNISAQSIAQIESWINYGAPENCLPLFEDVKNIFDQNECNSCHSNGQNSWSYETYYDMVGLGSDASCNLVNVKPYSLVESLLFDKINNDGSISCGDEMQGINGPLSNSEIATIRDWINGGALESASSLPVVLNNFSARDRGVNVLIEWTTEVEISTNKFLIERSNINRKFDVIGEVEAAGTSFTSLDYKFEDNHPLIGDNYYRLKMVDLDESYDYSNIRKVTTTQSEALVKIYPNPAMSYERIKVEWIPELNIPTTYLKIIDATGIHIDKKIIFPGTNYIRLPKLNDGIYYITVDNHFSGRTLERLVVIN